jgi:hypothetical protein
VVKRQGREADHSPPSSAEVKNAWSYTSTPQYAFITWCSVKGIQLCLLCEMSHDKSYDTLCVKVKEKLSLGLTKHHAMKTYWRCGSIAPRILTLALDGSEWSASLPGRFTHGEDPTVPNGQEEAEWAPEPILTWWQREKSRKCPYRELNPHRPAHGLVSIPTKPLDLHSIAL